MLSDISLTKSSYLPLSIPNPLTKSSVTSAEVTEDFVKGFGIDSGKYDDLVKEISDSMEKEKDAKIKEQVRIGLMNHLREKNQIQIPEVMIKNEATAMQKDWMRRSGIEDESKAPELENFNQIATERVHLGLLVNELVLSREMELHFSGKNQFIHQ